eukprot:Colp12_sorted_trinity150504_noHs@1009
MALTGKGLKVAVFGSGSFGTAMASVFARTGAHTVVLTRDPAVEASINNEHKNCKYLTNYTLPENLVATTDAKVALDGCDYIVHSIPLQASENFLRSVKDLIPPRVPIVSTSKGLHTETLEMMADLIPKALDRDQPAIFFSGPTFAKELMEKQLTGAVLACKELAEAQRLQSLLHSTHLRVYVTTDVVGVEVGGALKNVFAIAAGCCEGLGFRYNTAAMLVTRGCAEMNRLAIAMGADANTMYGLAGIGDLMLTCFGALSRNRTFGVRLGKGETVQEILASVSEVAEGVATTPAASKLAKKYNVDAPIITTISRVIEGEILAKEAVSVLMSLPTDFEFQPPVSFTEQTPPADM